MNTQPELRRSSRLAALSRTDDALTPVKSMGWTAQDMEGVLDYFHKNFDANYERTFPNSAPVTVAVAQAVAQAAPNPVPVPAPSPAPAAIPVKKYIDPKTQLRRSSRLAALPRADYALADAQLDRAVEKYIDPDAYAAKEARAASAARREAVRKAKQWVARMVSRTTIRKTYCPICKMEWNSSHCTCRITQRDAHLTRTICDIAKQIVSIRSRCQFSFNPIDMLVLASDVNKILAVERPTWTPANLAWAFKHVTGH